MDAEKLFALADVDDAVGLAATLGGSEAFRIRSESGETLFAWCVFRGKAKCAELLKARREFSLQDAALAGDTEIVARLVDSAPWSVDTLSPDGWTALHLAAFLGRDAALLALLDRGASARIFSRAFEQNLPVHAAAAGRQVGRDAFARLVAATGNPDALQKQGLSALMIAAGNNFTEAVDVLLSAGADRSIRSPDGKTAADFAKERGHAALAERLTL